MKRFFILTGESSGDHLGALLGKGLLDKGYQTAGWGGQKMAAEGIELFQDISNLKVMGWTDVIRRLPFFIGLISKAKQDILSFQSDTLLLIDFGSFNLRIAKWAKSHDIKVVYYSPPKIWASRPGRITQLKAYTDLVIVLFPFEQEYYWEQGLNVFYFGHPVANIINSYQPDPLFKDKFGLDNRPVLSILPGSRKKEVQLSLAMYLKAAEKCPEYQICISCADGLKSIVEKIVSLSEANPIIIHDHFYDLLSHTDLALVTSGTATLETALFKIPQVVGYRTSWLNYRIARWLITTKYIALPNLISGKNLVPELIQEELNPHNLHKNIIRFCQVDTKSKIEIGYNGIINDIYNEKCLFNTIVTISSEST